MNKAVLDASAILALLQNERGAERLTEDLLNRAVVGAVNLAEVQAKLVKAGFDAEEAWEHALAPVTAIEAFTADQAKTAGSLVRQTAKYGLSLGDRACLALAVELQAEVYTTEQLWKNLKPGIPIHVIR